MTEHDGQHTDCPPCFAIKLRTVQFGASCTPNLRPEAVRQARNEAIRTKDLDAYKALVQSGVQPARTYGAADLATSDSKWVIESGRLIRDRQWIKKVETILDDVPAPPA